MTDLRQAAQAVVERWDSPKWEWSQQGPTADLMASLRTALKQQQAEPVSHAVIVGALFDFMGWLTTRKERLILSSTDNASPAADAIKVFAEMRGLSLDDALVQDWQNHTTPPQQQAEPVEGNTLLKAFLASAKEAGVTHLQQAEPVAWMDREGDLYKMPEIENWAPPHTMLYTTPPQQQAEPSQWRDMVVVSLVREGVNKHKARELADHFAAPPQRQWVGLTDEDFLEACQIAERGNYLLALQRIQIKLKERNNG